MKMIMKIVIIIVMLRMIITKMMMMMMMMMMMIFIACIGMHMKIGCYWGTEKFFKSDFGVKAFPGSGKVLSGKVGFMGPPTAKPNPSYREVRRILSSSSSFIFVAVL